MAKHIEKQGISAGDYVEVRGLHGQPTRRGQVVELIGEMSHERFRVRWDEDHESIVYPADGVMIVPERARAAHSGR